MEVKAFKVSVGDAAGYTVNVTLTKEDEGHQQEVVDSLFYLGAKVKDSKQEGDNLILICDVIARDINSFVDHLKTELSSIMARPVAAPAELAEPKAASISGGKVMELIFNKQTFMSVKEKMDPAKYVEQGEKEKLDFKPTAPAVPTSQKTENGLGAQFVEQGEKGKLQYPNVGKEIKMDKSAAQQLPGSDKVDAGSVIEQGQKEKLQFPTKPGPDPKVKMQGLDNSNEARKQIEQGEKGKIQHGQSAGKDIKIEWQVNSDTSIGAQFMEKGDKGGNKTVSGPAKEPGVSAQKESGADKFIERGENTKPIQKQFSLNFKRASAEEKEVAVTEAIDNAILELEVAASKCGVDMKNTRMVVVYTALQALKEGVKKQGSLFALTVPAVVPETLKVTASVKVIDADAAAIETGRRIF
jgi:hypothetical protein